MNINHLKPINKLNPFTKFCCTIGNLPSSYLDSMTYYEQLLWFCNFLEKTVIPTLNTNAEAVQELQNLFVELKNFVDNYFENLDVQEEINNKLDEMAESGVLESILLNYVNVTKVYNTTVEMLEDTNLKNGMKVKTLGYYEINDGGEAEYYISDLENNEYYQESLQNNLFANLLISNNEINFKQIGGRPQKLDGTKYDNKIYLERFVSKFSNLKYKPILYIPRGIYYFSETNINIQYSITLKGDLNLLENYGSVITSYNNNQNYVWKVGNTTDFRTVNFNILGGLTFSSANFIFNEDYNDLHIDYIKKCNSTLIFNQVTFGVFENLVFYYNDGTAFSLKSCYELHFKKLFFRACYGFDSDKMLFLENISGSNSSANTFDEIMFEDTEGNLIGFDSHSNFVNNIIKSLNFEDKHSNLPLVNDGVYNDENAIHWAIFNIKDSISSNAISYIESNIINNIYVNNMASKYHIDENQNQYCYDTILFVGGYNRVNWILNSISSQGQLKQLVLLRNNKLIKPNIQSNIVFNNFIGYANLPIPIKFDVKYFPSIEIGNLKFSGNTPNINSLLNNQILEVFRYSRKNSNTGGLICSDDNSIVDSKLCLSLKNRTINNNTSAFHIYKPSNTFTLSIHAKISDGETYLLRANGKNIENENNDVNNPISMLGNGEWTWYTFNTDFENYSPNKPIVFDGYLNTDNIECLIDAVRFL